MLNPTQFAIELVLIAAALLVSRAVGGAARRPFVLGFAALAALLNLAFYSIAVWPLYLPGASRESIDPTVLGVAVVVESIRWGILALVLSRLAVRLQDHGEPGGFVWLRAPRELPKSALIGMGVGVAASAAMYRASVIEQHFGYLPSHFWTRSGNPQGLAFTVGAGLRNLAGEEVFARLGVQALALYALRQVRGRGVLAVVLSALVFEFWHNPFERPAFLNFTGSAVFGWAYHKRGYEAAAVAHCVADWIVLGVFPRV